MGMTAAGMGQDQEQHTSPVQISTPDGQSPSLNSSHTSLLADDTQANALVSVRLTVA